MADVQDSIQSWSRALEEQFFRARDHELLEKMRAERAREADREHLAGVTGVEDAGLLDCLLDLGLHPASLAALSLAPLVEVAWADGEIAAEERAAIMAVAGEHGLVSPGADLLESWLHSRPGPELLEAWAKFAHHLADQMGAEHLTRLRDEVLRHANRVAKAEGGVLRLGAVCAEERVVLKRIEEALTEG